MLLFLKVTQRIEEAVAAAAFILMFGIIFVEVLLREAFDKTLSGSEEIAIICSVVAGFVGFSLVTGAGTHLRATFLDALVSERHERIIVRYSDLVSAILLMGLAIVALTYVRESYVYGDRIPILLWKLWPFQITIAYALGVSALKHLVFFLTDTRPAPQPAR